MTLRRWFAIQALAGLSVVFARLTDGAGAQEARSWPLFFSLECYMSVSLTPTGTAMC